jgi:MYXO-CTERM domain-containing protein
MGILKGFALSPDGKTILVGGETDGVWRGASDMMQFEKVSSVGIQCLTWSQAAVYACGSELKDKFTVGRSTNQGETFEPLMHLSCVRGPLACSADTEVGKECPAVWPATAEILDQPSCFNGTGGDGGAGGAPDAGGNGGGGSGDDSGGCGCRAAPTSGAAGFTGALLGLVAAARRTRRSRLTNENVDNHGR